MPGRGPRILREIDAGGSGSRLHASAVNRIVSHLPGVKRAVRQKGRAIEKTAKALFAEHDRPGGHRIVGETQDTDFIVSLEGPAPAAVEFGRAGYISQETQVIGEGHFIGPAEGLHVLGRAVDANG